MTDDDSWNANEATVRTKNRREWYDALLRNGAQLLSSINRHAARDREHAEAMGVVSLAIELARLRGLRQPTSMLDEAAELITEARKALQRQAKRSDREADEIKHRLVEVFELPDIPIKKLVREGEEADTFEMIETRLGSVRWKVYTSWRGFEMLLLAVLRARVVRGLEDLKQALNDGKTAEAREAFEKLALSPADAKRFQQVLKGDLSQSKVESLMAEMQAAGLKFAVQFLRKEGMVPALLFEEMTRERERRGRGQTKRARDSARKTSNQN